MKKFTSFVLVWLLISLLSVKLVLAEAERPGLRPRIMNEVREMKQDRVEKLNEKRMEIKERVENKIQTMSQKREDFKARLMEIKDERKQAIALRVDERMEALNQKVTTLLSSTLERLGVITDKLADKTDVSGAKTAISTAQVAVDAQAKKEYTIEFADEDGLKVGASTAKEALRADLQIVRDLVRVARQAVGDALAAAQVSVSESN